MWNNSRSTHWLNLTDITFSRLESLISSPKPPTEEDRPWTWARSETLSGRVLVRLRGDWRLYATTTAKRSKLVLVFNLAGCGHQNLRNSASVAAEGSPCQMQTWESYGIILCRTLPIGPDAWASDFPGAYIKTPPICTKLLSRKAKSETQTCTQNAMSEAAFLFCTMST